MHRGNEIATPKNQCTACPAKKASTRCTWQEALRDWDLRLGLFLGVDLVLQQELFILDHSLA